ncbi:MAG: type secretion system secreted protein VgrG, partial [Paraburkholderia sp.]|nr:type secretion system secreted protein VgrG [Paraburkholderia sp.]
GDTGRGNVGAGTREITGLVTSARLLREEGRAIVYEMVLRPWLWLATKNQDCRLFQDMNVAEITDAVLSAYTFPVEKRLFGPSPREPYPKRDIQRQHWESDWTFLQRLWEEWGIFYWFEHSGGKHRLVLADAMASHRPHGEAYGTIRYEAPSGRRIDEEHIHALSVEVRLTTGRVSSVDYDYTRPRADLTATYEDPRDTAQARQEFYTWGDYAQPQAGAAGLLGEPNQPRSEADYLAKVRMQAMRCAGLRAKGQGGLRGLAVGHTFALTHYPQKAANREYVVVSSTLDIEDTGEASGTGQRYRCTTDFEIQPTNEAFRLIPTIDKPRASGPESAIVTGPSGQEIWTDAYGRIKVRFIWDRHGKTDQNSSCWVRVASPWQGGQFGTSWLPRIGHEVIVNFINGDLDRPIVTHGGVPNEFNKPAWALPDNQAVSGVRCNELGHSGRANHLAFDDTKGEIQAQLSSDHGSSQLSLGFLRRILGNKGRQDARGKGFELRTDFVGAMRAAMGLLITTEARTNAQGHAKDMDETVARLTQARDIHESMTGLAQQHGAQRKNADQSEVAKAIKAQNDSIRGGTLADDNPFPEFAAPHLTLSSPAGIETTTAGSTHISSVENFALTTGASVGIAAGKSFFASIRNGFSVFVHRLGINLIAASGKVRVEAQDDAIELVAQRVIDIISKTDSINLTAKKEIVLHAAGSRLVLNEEGYIVYTGGKHLVHAGDHATAGPQSKPLKFPVHSFSEECALEHRYRDDEPVRSAKFAIAYDDGTHFSGSLDHGGRADLSSAPQGCGRIRFGADARSWQNETQDVNPGYAPSWTETHFSVSANKNSNGV